MWMCQVYLLYSNLHLIILFTSGSKKLNDADETSGYILMMDLKLMRLKFH